MTIRELLAERGITEAQFIQCKTGRYAVLLANGEDPILFGKDFVLPTSKKEQQAVLDMSVFTGAFDRLWAGNGPKVVLTIKL